MIVGITLEKVLEDMKSKSLVSESQLEEVRQVFSQVFRSERSLLVNSNRLVRVDGTLDYFKILGSKVRLEVSNATVVYESGEAISLNDKLYVLLDEAKPEAVSKKRKHDEAPNSHKRVRKPNV